MTFAIDVDNNITVLDSPQEIEERQEGTETFSRSQELAALAAQWPGPQLVEIWNSLPGVEPVERFTSRQVAATRIWKAWWNLGRVFRDSGDLPAALDCYAKAWRIDRGLSEAALEYGKMLPSKKAQQVWREALQRDALNQKLQQAYLSILKDPEEAGRAPVRAA